MSKQIKLLFNSSGVLTSTQADHIRQGDANINLVASFEGKSNINYVARYTLTRPDGKIAKGLMNNSSTVTDFEKVLDSAYYFAVNGAVTLTIFLFGNGQVVASGQTTISVEQTDFSEETTITPDEYNELLLEIQKRIKIKDGILVVDNLPTDYEGLEDGQIFFERQSMQFYEFFNEEFTTIDLTNYDKVYTIDEINTFLSHKQETLVSGENIKTVNGESLLGSGNLVISVPVSSVNGKTGAVVLNATDIKLTTNQTTVQQNFIRIDEEINRVEGKFDALIPSEASASNKLADKNFVNSSIATNTANYIYKIVGGEKVPFNSLQELESQTALTPTLNDYAFVVSTDAQGNTVYNRYKYTSEGWAFEYALNNSSFTASQWSAINSGITSGKIAQYDAYGSSINALNTRVNSVEASLTKNGIETILGESWTQIELDEE